MKTNYPSPLKMTARAAKHAPRWALVTLLFCFIVSGFFSTALWTPREATAFASALSIYQGTLIDWLLPSINGIAHPNDGPLNAWLAASFLLFFDQWLDLTLAHRLSTLVWFVISISALWFGTWHLARLPEAQPVSFAFGGEAKMPDYARAVADCAIFLFVATFGFVIRQHEAVPDTALVAISALTFYSLTWSLRRPYLGSLTTGIAIAFGIFASSLFAGLTLFLSSLIILTLQTGFKGSRDLRAILLTSSTLLTFSLWPLCAFLLAPEAAAIWFSQWGSLQASLFGLISVDTLEWLFKNTLWYLYPLWPLVAWGLYAWRHHLNKTHLCLPLTLVVAGSITLFLTNQYTDNALLLLVIPLSVFAAFSVGTFRKASENILDWFSIATFTLALTIAWGYWLAWNFNFAPKMAKSLHLLAPNSVPTVDFAWFLAFLSSVVWIIFVVWRYVACPVVVWRGPWLAAWGMSTTLLAATGLFHNAITENRSYEPIAIEMLASLQTNGWLAKDCIETTGLSPSLQSLLNYYGGFVLVDAGQQSCRFTLLRSQKPIFTTSEPLSVFARPHTSERFYLLKNY